MVKFFLNIFVFYFVMFVIIFNIVVNVLGLGNVVIFMGLKVMVEMDKLNLEKGIVIDVMCLFLVINIFLVIIIFISVIIIWVSVGVINFGDIILFIIIVIFCFIIMVVVVVKFFVSW